MDKQMDIIGLLLRVALIALIIFNFAIGNYVVAVSCLVVFIYTLRH